MLRVIVPLLLITALMCAAVPLRSIAQHVSGSSYGTNTNQNNNCANSGISYPGNPFSGWPIVGAGWANVTAFYCDSYYMMNFGYAHWGIDLGLPTGTPVIATADATVARAEFGHAARGNNVMICTPLNWCATHMHFSTVDVVVGQTVTFGTQLGTVGSTGNSTGPHLHYEIHDPAGVAVDPAPTLP